MNRPGMLEDMTVVDLSGITAGGRSTQLLADFGANVIKVESYERPDTFRNWAAVTGAAEAGDLSSPPFRVVGRNKRAIAVDLRDPLGLEVARRLVERADIVVENFRRGVLEKLNLSYEQLTKWNPRVVLLSLSSQGSEGPFRNHISYGVTLEALGGLMSMTSYGDGAPIWTTPKVNYPDQIVAMLGPALAIAAVRESRSTGRGSWIDLSQRELVTSLLGEWILHSEITGKAPSAPGQDLRGSGVVVQAAGHDEWIAVTAQSQDELSALLEYLEKRVEPKDKAGIAESSPEQRAESLLRAWALKHDKFELMKTLQAEGIACAAVLNSREVVEQGAARGDDLYLQVPHPSGKMETHVGLPFAITPDQGAGIRLRAPHIGEQSCEILRTLGFAEKDIEHLLDKKIVHQPASN